MSEIKKWLSNLFIPQEENNFRARTLHLDFLTYYLIFALIFTLSFQQIQHRFTDILGYATDISIEKLFGLTNWERAQKHLSPLSYNQELAKAAQSKAKDMFTKNYWSHYGPDGETPWDFILGAGYHYEYAGENLAKNFLFSQGVIDAWMNSPSHRENILRSQYTEVGFAVVNGILNGEQTTLVVQIFGRPQSGTLAANEQNSSPSTIQTQPQVLAKSSSDINLFSLPFYTQIIFFIFLLSVLLLDVYFAFRMNIIRISGKSIAHVIFISFILIGLLVLAHGSIL